MTDPTDPLKDGLTRSQPYFPRRREGNSLDNPVLAAYKGAH